MSFLNRLSKAAEKLGKVAGRAAVDAYELVDKVQDKLDEVVATIDRGIEAGLKAGYDKRHEKPAHDEIVRVFEGALNEIFESPQSTPAEKQYETLLGDKDLFKDTAPATPSAEETSFGASLQEGLATGDTGLKATVNKAAKKPAVKKPAVKKAPAKKPAVKKPKQ